MFHFMKRCRSTFIMSVQNIVRISHGNEFTKASIDDARINIDELVGVEGIFDKLFAVKAQEVYGNPQMLYIEIAREEFDRVMPKEILLRWAREENRRIERTEASKLLRELITSREELMEAIKRKRRMRPSEKAMSLAKYERQIDALNLAIHKLGE